MWKSIVAISVGASFGALLRWWLGNQLNSLFPTIPPGTLFANLIGGYVIGIAIALCAALFLLTERRLYLHWAGKLFKVGIAAALLFFVVLLLERLA